MKKTKLLFIDVDGTLTRGEVIYTQSGEEIKKFNIKDGLALSVWNNKMGRISAIVTGRECEIVKKRAAELGIHYVYMGVKDKGAVVREILTKNALQAKECACIGDDINDLPMFKLIAQSYAPKDCANGIKHRVKYILRSKGGKGAVREMIENILQREKDNALTKYFS